jgi:hypothetical protein
MLNQNSTNQAPFPKKQNAWTVSQTQLGSSAYFLF